jgi:hypothetical protein
MTIITAFQCDQSSHIDASSTAPKRIKGYVFALAPVALAAIAMLRIPSVAGEVVTGNNGAAGQDASAPGQRGDNGGAGQGAVASGDPDATAWGGTGGQGGWGYGFSLDNPPLGGNGGAGGSASATGPGNITANAGGGGNAGRAYADGGDGASADAESSGSWSAWASAMGGPGGDGDHGHGGLGGTGTAIAQAVGTTDHHDASAYARATGGSGGTSRTIWGFSSGMGFAGLGGAAHATATAQAVFAGTASATAEQFGGSGADGWGGANASSGTDSSLEDAVDATSSGGAVTLTQNCTGGDGGGALYIPPQGTPNFGQPGSAGNATSTLHRVTEDELTYSVSTRAQGGGGGGTVGDVLPLAGGKGTASSTVTSDSTTHITVTAVAIGGQGGNNLRFYVNPTIPGQPDTYESTGAQGGEAEASSSGLGYGDVDASATATGGTGGNAPTSPGIGGPASALANATSYGGTATAYASATGGSGGSADSGDKAMGGNATATAIANGTAVRDTAINGGTARANITSPLSSGTMAGQTVTVGDGTTTTFTQSGTGSVAASQSVTITGGSRYNLGGGTLTTPAMSNSGTFSQSSGVANVGDFDGYNGGNGTVSVSGGTLTANHVRQTQLSVTGAGVVKVNSNGGNSGTSRVNNLTVSGSTGAKLNLSDNDLVIDYQAPASNSPYASIKAEIARSRNAAGGRWTGAGITSSNAAVNPDAYSLGLAESSDLFGFFGGTFSGQSVDSTAVLVKFTYVGDANLDGKVDQTDISLWGAGDDGDFPASWHFGDFNYDGVVNMTDYNLLLTGESYYNSGGQLGRTTVPEPACAVLMASLLWARRRRISSVSQFA